MKNMSLPIFLILALAFAHEANAGKIVGTLESSNGRPMDLPDVLMDKELESGDGMMPIPIDRNVDYLETQNCKWTGWVNDYDKELSYTAPLGKVIKGVASKHTNKHEDRIFEYYVCDVKIEVH